MNNMLPDEKDRKRRFMMRSLLVLVLLHVQLARSQQCSQLSGPAGTATCLKLSGYTHHQWATCLTNNYIKQKSGHRHHCVRREAIYCWYQCMVEVHSKNFGFVAEDCRCTPGEALSTSLPQACYSPSGDYCNWYRSCLRRKYSCQDTSNAYVVRYAEKFCELYDERRASFSVDGQKWVDAVRRCLQVDLVPLIRPWVTASCYNLRQKALATHIPCYTNPDQNVTSVCDLKCTDYLRVFWFIKGSFTKMDTAWESMKGLWNMETRCNQNSRISQCLKDQGAVEGMMKFTKISVRKFQQRGEHTSGTLSQQDAGSRFADGVGSSIAKFLTWNTIVMDWIAYTDSFVARDDVEITMVLADRKALGIVTTSVSVNLNFTIYEFASAIEEGKLPLQVDGYNVWVRSMELCSDKFCAQTQTLAVSDNPPKWPNEAARISYGKVGLLAALAFSFLFQSFF